LAAFTDIPASMSCVWPGRSLRVIRFAHNATLTDLHFWPRFARRKFKITSLQFAPNGAPKEGRKAAPFSMAYGHTPYSRRNRTKWIDRLSYFGKL